MSSRRRRKNAKKKTPPSSFPVSRDSPTPTAPSASPNISPLRSLSEMFPDVENVFLQEIYTSHGCHYQNTLEYLLAELRIVDEKPAKCDALPDFVSAMPIDTFLYVCSFLNVHSLANLGSSSKLCFEQSKEVYSRMLSLNVGGAVLRNLPDQDILAVISRYTHLRHLSLTKCSRFSSFRELPFCCSSSMSSLSITSCQHLDDEYVIDMLSRLPSIKRLNFARTPALSDYALDQMGRLKGLNELNLSSCNLITTEGILTLLKKRSEEHTV